MSMSVVSIISVLFALIRSECPTSEFAWYEANWRFLVEIIPYVNEKGFELWLKVSHVDDNPEETPRFIEQIGFGWEMNPDVEKLKKAFEKTLKAAKDTPVTIRLKDVL